MSKRYPGNFITGNPVALSQTSNNGIWDVTDVSAAVAAGTWQEPDGIYEIPRSLRFRSSATAYLNRTPTTAGNTKTWTWSGWVKRGTLGSQQALFNAGVTAGQQISGIAFSSGSGVYDKLELWSGIQGVSTEAHCQSLAFYRDPSAWYHIVVAVDTTQSISSNRVKLYVNGSALSIAAYASYNTYPSQNYAYAFNNTVAHQIARDTVGTPNYFDGHLTEVNFIDGQALDPSYFGYNDPVTNNWQPKKYTGGYGTNGFYLPFTDNASVQTLGRNYTSNYVADNNNIAASSWSKVNSVTATANSAVAPDGTTTASSLIENSLASNNWVNQATGFTTISGNVYTTSAFIKPVGRTWVMIQNDNFTNGGAGRPYAWFNLSGSGAVGNTNSTNASILPLANGWYRCTMTTTVPSTNSGETFYVGIYPAPSNGTLVNPGTGTTALRVWGVAANAGSSLNTLGNVPFNATSPINPTGGGDWTPNNFSLTAGASYDSMVDSPTNVFTTATDIGGVVPGNYATLNPLTRPVGGGGAFTVGQGGLQTAMSYVGPDSTIAMSSGKWYWEVIITGGLSAYNPRIGIVPTNHGTYSGTSVGDGAGTYGYTSTTGQKGSGGTYTAYGAAYAENDVIGVALDMDNGTLTFYKNGVSQGVAYTGITGEYYASVGSGSTGGGLTVQFNFGQRQFAYSPPAGFKSLNTTNIQALGTSGVGNAAITPHKWFDINLYPGNSSTQRIVNSGGVQPDLVWGKSRNIAENNALFDSVRGATRALYSNLTNVETTDPGVSEFNTNGFSLNGATINATTYSYIAWQWKQSPTAGFNIVPYIGDGTNSKTISHNLGVKPSMIIIKNRDAVGNWIFEHVGLPDGRILLLNDTQAQSGQFLSEYLFYQRTSSNFLVGSFGAGSNSNNNGQKYIAYLFAEVPGFSKFGSYVGNGSANGPFVYCGFKPKFVMWKNSSAVQAWLIEDTTRSTYNEVALELYPSSSGAEATGSSRAPTQQFDYLSNGFKVRGAQEQTNGSGNTIIFAAFAESPFGLNNRAR